MKRRTQRPAACDVWKRTSTGRQWHMQNLTALQGSLQRLTWSMKPLAPPRVLSSCTYSYTCACTCACTKLAKPFFGKNFWILVLMSMVVNWKDIFSNQWEQSFLMWQLFMVNSWNSSAVLFCSQGKKVLAPRTGSLGSRRQSAFTRHPCRQFQLFYTNQEVSVPAHGHP